MNKFLFLFLIMPICLFAQSKNQINEDRARIIAMEESQKVEDRLRNDMQEIKLLQDEVASLKTDLVTYQRIGLLLLAILGTVLLWLRSMIKKKIADSVEKETKNEFNKRDPHRWTIRIPQENFEVERLHLEKLKYRKLEHYNGLDFQTKKGIVVCHANSDDDLQKLLQIVAEDQIDPSHCCFVLYSKGKHLTLSLLDGKVNYVTSNMPGTLSTQINAAAYNITKN